MSEVWGSVLPCSEPFRPARPQPPARAFLVGPSDSGVPPEMLRVLLLVVRCMMVGKNEKIQLKYVEGRIK